MPLGHPNPNVVGENSDVTIRLPFRRWAADPANRSDPGRPRQGPAKVHPRLVNDDLRAVAELLDFMAANQAEARPILGPLAAPWTAVTDAHAACWLRQVSRIPHTRTLNEANYVDDHALAQITAALPLLGMPALLLVLLAPRTEVSGSAAFDPTGDATAAAHFGR